MIAQLTDSFYEVIISLIDKLPDVPSLELPAETESALMMLFQFVGWLMPYAYYIPLMTFILGLTAFRIIYTIYLKFKKN